MFLQLFLPVSYFCFLSAGQEIAWEEHLRIDLFCDKWDVKPELNQSVNQSGHFFESLSMLHSCTHRKGSLSSGK